MSSGQFNESDPADLQRKINQITLAHEETARHLQELSELATGRAKKVADPEPEMPDLLPPPMEFIAAAKRDAAQQTYGLDVEPVDVNAGPTPPELEDWKAITLAPPPMPEEEHDVGSPQLSPPLPAAMQLPDLPQEPFVFDAETWDTESSPSDTPEPLAAPATTKPVYRDLPDLPPPAPPAPHRPTGPELIDDQQLLGQETQLDVTADLKRWSTYEREYKRTLHDILRAIVADLQADYAELQSIRRHFELTRRSPV